MNLNRQKSWISQILRKVGPRIETHPETSLEACKQVENSEGAVCGPVAGKRDGRPPKHWNIC